MKDKRLSEVSEMVVKELSTEYFINRDDLVEAVKGRLYTHAYDYIKESMRTRIETCEGDAQVARLYINGNGKEQAMDDVYADVKERIQAHEGCILYAYKDTMGVWTVGYGHRIRPEEMEGLGTLTKREAHLLFQQDFDVACTSAKREFSPIWHHINTARQGVLIEMVFQLGVAGVSQFRKMRKALDTYDYRMAAVEMLHSKWARQTTERCCILALIMMRGEDIGQRVGGVKA